MDTTDKSTPQATSNHKKILVVYFSHTGNTREIANQIHNQVGGDIFEIQTVQPYPTDYKACVKQAKQELESDSLPKLKSTVPNIESFDVIFIGYPNWWGTIPMPVVTFLLRYNFPGKTVFPFCTHGGGGFGRGIADIKQYCPKSTIPDSLAILGTQVKSAHKEVTDWLRKAGMIK